MTSDLERAFEFQLKAHGYKPGDYEAEFRFHPTRKWRFDFAFPECLLGIECEGGTWVQGRHNRPASFELDCEKYAEAAILGWRVLRFTNHMIEDGRAIQLLERALGKAAA